MKVGTVAEVRNIDKLAIEEYGLSSIVLMENAGHEVSSFVKKLLLTLPTNAVCVIAGKGNNAGDAFVAARHMQNAGVNVQVFTIGEISVLTKPTYDCKVNYELIKKMGIKCIAINDKNSLALLETFLSHASVIVDGLFGTGFRGKVDGIAAEVMHLINCAEKKVVSIDVPSGINADDGSVGTSAVVADYTITMAIPKLGMFLYPAVNYVGEIVVKDIGLPSNLLVDSKIKQGLIGVRNAKMLLPYRPIEIHKGSCGKLSIWAGSVGMAGAAAFSGKASVNCGTGITRMYLENNIYGIVSTLVPEAIYKVCDDGRIWGNEHEHHSIISWLNESDAVLLGPGLGKEQAKLDLITRIITDTTCPILLDADAIGAFVGRSELLSKANAPMVITPHPGELARLFNTSAKEVNERRVYYAREAAARFNCVVVLKGAKTIIAMPDKRIFINSSGTRAMAIGGTGDVLSGTIASFMAQGLTTENAAVLGTYVHGLAGELAASGVQQGVSPMMLADNLSKAIREVQEFV